MEKRAYGVEEFLSRPKTLEEEIRGDIDHIASLRSIVEKTTTQLSFTAGRNPSKNEKAFENVMIQIAEEEQCLETKQKLLVGLKMEVENLINHIPEADQQKFLRLKYLNGMDMIAIRGIIGLSKSSIYRLHEKALRTASSIFTQMGLAETAWDKTGKNISDSIMIAK